MDQPTPEKAAIVAMTLLGFAPQRLERFSPAVGGDDSHSFRLWRGSAGMLLKIKKRPGTPIGVYFHRRLKQAHIPVPELIAFSSHAGPGGEACAIWEWIDGRPAEWKPGEACPYDEAEFGDILRRIHELRFEGSFGLLGDDPATRIFRSHPDLESTSDTWLAFFGCARAAKRYFDKGYITRHEADLLTEFPARLAPAFQRVQPRLLHMGDIMHHGNMIVDSTSRHIHAVVDYVESMAGDPRWELAWVDYYFEQFPYNRVAFDMEAFRAGYGAIHDPGDPVSRFYLLAILLFEKLLFFDPRSEKGRWAIATVKEVLNELSAA